LESVKHARYDLRKKKFFLVGSDDDLYCQAADAILKDEIKELGGTVVDSELVTLGEVNWHELAERIKKSQAGIIFNTVDGAGNLGFTNALRRVGLKQDAVPTVWLGIGEEEMGILDRSMMIGDLSVTPYFHSIDTPANKAFLLRFKEEFRTRQR